MTELSLVIGRYLFKMSQGISSEWNPLGALQKLNSQTAFLNPSLPVCLHPWLSLSRVEGSSRVQSSRGAKNEKL